MIVVMMIFNHIYNVYIYIYIYTLRIVTLSVKYSILSISRIELL